MRLLDLLEDHNHPERGDVRWAVGKNRSKASMLAQRDLKDPDYVLVWANIQDIMKNAVPNMALDLDDPTGGRNRIGQRVSNAKMFWSGGNHMDPSLIYMRGSKVDFQDGRHRLVAAYQLGHRYAPVLVNRDGLRAFQRVVRVKQNETLLEAQVLELEAFGKPVKVWKNPTLSQTQALVKRIDQMRGIDDNKGNFYMWDAHDAYHGRIAKALGVDFWSGNPHDSFYLTQAGRAREALEWNGAPNFTINGINIWADTDTWSAKSGIGRAVGRANIPRPGKAWNPERTAAKLAEAQSFEITMSHHGGRVRVWKNPTRQQTQALVERLGEARAISTMSGDFYLWPAFHAIHETVAKELGVRGVRFFLTPIEGEKEAPEWAGPPLEINGIWAWAEPGAYAAWKYPGTVRALGLARRSRYPKNWKEPLDESAQVIKVNDLQNYKRSFRIWKNPTASQTRALVNTIGDMRATCGGSNFYLWNAHDATHADIEYELDTGGENLYLVPQGQTPQAQEWADNKPDVVINGIEVRSTMPQNAYRLKGVIRALGLKQGLGEAIQRDRGSSDRMYAFNPTKLELAVFFKEDGGAAGVLDPKGNFGIGAGSLLAHHEVLQRLGMEESEMPNLQVMPKALIAECWISADDIPEDLTDKIENRRTVLAALEKTAYPKKRRQQIAMALKKNPRIKQAYGGVPPVVIHVLGDWTGEVVFKEPY